MYPPPPETNCKGDRHGMWWACGSITTVSTDLFMFAPMTTYQLLVSPGGLAENIYQVFGDTVNPMMLPPAYQDSAAGANFGGVSPDAVAGSPTAAFDSWLTVGETTGDSGGKLSAFGINFGSWTGTTGLLVPNGYVSLSDQVNAPTSDVVVAQLTAPTATRWTAVLNVKGRAPQTNGEAGTGTGWSGEDYEARGLEFTAGGVANAMPTVSVSTPTPSSRRRKSSCSYVCCA